MKKLLFFIFIVGFIGFVSSCSLLHDWNQQEEPEIEYSPVWPLSGEWWVVYRFDDGSGVVDDYYGVGHTLLFTYNTANNDVDQLWISDGGNIDVDHANFWSFCVKSPCNVGTKSFAGADLVSTADGGGVPYDITVNVTNGKVIQDGGISPSGVVCDSIYFELEFQDDPGTIYQCSGIRKTGFL
ncbi:MAG: hypothetical protein M0P66_07705, partial [Salinivirgaceae bacterium]|nr:hypothetical protein [Salinivirgaceae bacterium]